MGLPAPDSKNESSNPIYSRLETGKPRRAAPARIEFENESAIDDLCDQPAKLSCAAASRPIIQSEPQRIAVWIVHWGEGDKMEKPSNGRNRQSLLIGAFIAALCGVGYFWQEPGLPLVNVSSEEAESDLDAIVSLDFDEDSARPQSLMAAREGQGNAPPVGEIARPSSESPIHRFVRERRLKDPDGQLAAVIPPPYRDRLQTLDEEWERRLLKQPVGLLESESAEAIATDVEQASAVADAELENQVVHALAETSDGDPARHVRLVAHRAPKTLSLAPASPGRGAWLAGVIELEE
jgi:hypothetical protein